jgi:hypothetical protein
MIRIREITAIEIGTTKSADRNAVIRFGGAV